MIVVDASVAVKWLLLTGDAKFRDRVQALHLVVELRG